jgi:hypothetical protein
MRLQENNRASCAKKGKKNMGTRADFYIGVGENAEWLGSVAFDGYEWAEEENNFIALSKSADEFRINVNKMLAKRDDATLPKDGWPWPWDDSKLTDFAYYFNDGKVGWEDQPVYPNMKDKKNVTLGKRSGLLVFGAKLRAPSMAQQ